MAASLIGGAAIGAVFGELLNAVLEMKDRAVMFKQALDSLASTLQAITPVIEEIEQHNTHLGRPKVELERLIREMEEGTKLVCECSKIPGWNYVAKISHQKRLNTLKKSLEQFFIIEMQAQIARDLKETLVKVGRILSTVGKHKMVGREETTVSSSNNSASIPGLGVSELEIHQSRATQLAENEAETNSAEQVLEPIAGLTQEVAQVELVLPELIDAPVVELYEDFLSLYNKSSDEPTDPSILRRLSEKLQLIGITDCTQESLGLHEMVAENGEDEGASIEMSMLLKELEDYVQKENPDLDDNVGANCLSSSCCRQGTNEKNHQPPVIPDSFRCPISLELMKDPVIVSTGQTYDRFCIEKQLEAGHRTFPVRPKTLSTTVFTPSSSPPSKPIFACSPAEQSKIENILQELTSCNLEDQRSAAAEIRLLAKQSVDNRVAIAEAGAIPLLVGLLSTTDSCIQEHAVTALLNISICDSNKASIMSSGALPAIIHVLEKGSMEARENAAATLHSLSVLHENRVTIGSSGAIPPLVTLLSEVTQRGKKDAATALYNLCIYEGNRAKAVKAGVVHTIMQLLKEPGGGMVVDEALDILSLLATCPEGEAAIGDAEAVPLLVMIIGNGSPRNKENAAATLFHLCSYLAQAKDLGAMGPLLELAQNGTDRGKRKATQLLELMIN